MDFYNRRSIYRYYYSNLMIEVVCYRVRNSNTGDNKALEYMYIL
jgi:hypothetical protein